MRQACIDEWADDEFNNCKEARGQEDQRRYSIRGRFPSHLPDICQFGFQLR